MVINPEKLSRYSGDHEGGTGDQFLAIGWQRCGEQGAIGERPGDDRCSRGNTREERFLQGEVASLVAADVIFDDRQGVVAEP